MLFEPNKEYERWKPRDDVMPEECGVFGIFTDDRRYDPAEATYLGLYALQHRGQESAGIAVSDGKGIKFHKGMGLCSEVFKDNLGPLLGGHIGIGHVRYSTTGDSMAYNAQPLVMSYRGGKFAMAHNGNLINNTVLREKLEDEGTVFQTTIDTEVMANLIARYSKHGMLKAISAMMKVVRGAYALVIMTQDELIAVRDPQGIRPLALGKLDNSYVVASESCAFDAIDAEFVRDIRPGEIIVINKNGLKSYQAQSAMDTALCVFEYVYFARPDSDIDGISVYRSRENMGTRLAQAFPIDADLVSDVPDSATPAASGYAAESGIPYAKALAKNRYVGRTFIQPSQALRERGVKLKLNAIKRNVHGKKLILIDDSIVRGTTSRKIVEMLRLAGAREVHMLISSPPVICPCFFGIDTPSHDQLVGSKNSVEEIRKIIGADTLHYLSIGDLLKTVEGAGCNFCAGCFNGQYPVDIRRALKETETMDLMTIE
ncbi:MAG: amidophosphoribosyltransferase [Christensenella hongkongensis]|uniref:amidophosphoribosyltransferase n=1 Tax=Christensenella hongkongensis TaxID=270498 RepID=UPI002A75FA5B|nr:amidophosphoribosyltransferase [Christensenella hongkongensis]MDY3004148.1 amidophosphoribosyltransferase [Christensenella hongkongensis]